MNVHHLHRQQTTKHLLPEQLNQTMFLNEVNSEKEGISDIIGKIVKEELQNYEENKFVLPYYSKMLEKIM